MTESPSLLVSPPVVGPVQLIAVALGVSPSLPLQMTSVKSITAALEAFMDKGSLVHITRVVFPLKRLAVVSTSHVLTVIPRRPTRNTSGKTRSYGTRPLPSAPS